METLGKSGCYFLSIVHLAECCVKERIDAVEQFLIALAEGNVKQDVFVVHPEKILSDITGVQWGMKKVTSEYLPSPEELEILRFERKEVGSVIGHFVVGNGKGGVSYDPYGDSRTVREGNLISKRIFYREA
jgi:hypothetical protein